MCERLLDDHSKFNGLKKLGDDERMKAMMFYSSTTSFIIAYYYRRLIWHSDILAERLNLAPRQQQQQASRDRSVLFVFPVSVDEPPTAGYATHPH
jgi:hypothetical protein